MSEHSGFFNSSASNEKEYGDTDMAKILGLLAGGVEGYFIGNQEELLVEAGTGLEVIVNPGAAILGYTYHGWWYLNDDDISLEIDAETSGYYRIDSIILRVDRQTEGLEVTAEVLKGTASSGTPSAPSLTQDEDVYEMELAQVYVTGGSTAITVTDKRQPVVCSQSTADEKTAAWTLGLTDIHKFILANSSSAITVTVPANSAVAFPVNTEIVIVQHGEGAVTISPASGVTVNSLEGNLVSDGQYSGFTLRKVDTDEWYAVGALTSE